VALHHDPRHFVQEQRVFEPRDLESFDRLQFAIEVLRALDLPRMRVAIYPRERELSVDHGSDLGRGPGATWAIVGIPPHASRRHIVHALAELAGVSDLPYVVDVLASSARAAS
jgi:hypothetical protein